MKRVCSISAVVLIIAYAIFRGNAPSSCVYDISSEQSESFVKEFSKRFNDKNDAWLVLGNRGITNYYVDRFSKNWFFWADHLSADSIGVSGSFLDLENWNHVSKILPKKVKYIAVDFNELVDYPKRNDIIESAKDILEDDGIFCIEDVYNNVESKFEHFTDEDFEELSQNFDIKFAVSDGYVSALPYTSTQSHNKRLDMYNGLETMILRLASAEKDKKKEILPHITKTLYSRSSSIDKKLIKELVRSVVTSPRLIRLIRKYENFVAESNQIAANIEKEEKEIESIKSEIGKFEKFENAIDSTSNTLTSISKNVNTIAKGVNALTGNKRKSGFSFFNNLSNIFGKESSADIQKKLKESRDKLNSHEANVAELKNLLELSKKDEDNVKNEILKCYEEGYEKFGRDELLKPYLEYKKTELDDIIKDSKEADREFWINYNSSNGTISEVELLSKELERSWSPEVLVQNEVSLEHIQSENRRNLSEKSRIVIIFVKNDN